MTKKNKVITFMALAAFLFPSCQSRNEFLWQTGCFIFLMYLATLAITLVMPKIHQLHWFQRLVEIIRIPTACVGSLIILIGAKACYIGFSRWYDGFNPQKMMAMLGAMIIIAGISLILWARKNQSPEKRILFSKIAIMSGGFGVAIYHLIKGGERLFG